MKCKELFKIYKDFESNCNKKANLYIDSVKDNIDKVKAILNKLIEEGKDVVVINEIEREIDDPDFIKGKIKKLDIAVMMPSSIYDEFEDLLENVMNKAAVYKNLEPINKTQ